MDRLVSLPFWACVLVLFSGCSLQKRTLMPGYHVEWVGGSSDGSRLESAAKELAPLEWKQADQLALQLPLAELTQPVQALRNSEYLVQTRSILPTRIAVKPTPAALAEPTPWEETYEEQKMFVNIALGALGLMLILGAVNAPPALLASLQAVALVSFALSRRKRREVLDIKEMNGYDVSAERAALDDSNRRMIRGALTYYIVAVLAAVAILAILVPW